MRDTTSLTGATCTELIGKRQRIGKREPTCRDVPMMRSRSACSVSLDSKSSKSEIKPSPKNVISGCKLRYKDAEDEFH